MKEIKWRKIISRGRHPILVTDTAALALIKYTKPVQGCPNFLFYKRIAGETFMSEAEWEKTKNFYKKRIKKSPFKLLNSVRDCNKRNEEIIKQAKKISKIDFAKTSYPELRKIFANFIDLYCGSWCYVYTPWIFEEILTEKIKKKLLEKIKDINEVERCLTTLIIPSKPVRDFKLKLELINLVRQIKRNERLKDIFSGSSQEIQSKLKNTAFLDRIVSLQKRYAWWGTYLFTVKEYKIKDMISDLKESLKKSKQKELKDFLNNYKEQKNKFRKAIAELKKLKLASIFFDYVKTIREVSFWRNHRIEDLSIIHFYLKPLIAEIAKRRGLAYEDIIWLTVEEIVKNKASIKDIKRRSKDHAYLVVNGKAKIYTEASLKELLRKELKRIEQIKEIKGTIANPGRVKGVAQVLQGVYQYKKIKPGKILVIPMTTPDITPYLKKTKAIVTNEGGLLCHAVIVSRELGIPCIIGTKIATKVLKDGDLIEVDANRGVVRISK